MKKFKFLLLLSFFYCASAHTETYPDSHRILFLMHTRGISDAIDLYQECYSLHEKHDLELLNQMGHAVLEQGAKSDNNEIQMLTLFGAGIANDEKSLYILEEGLRSAHPQIQLIALNLITKSQSDSTQDALTLAMRSNQILIRFEALLHMAEMHHPKAVGQAESLMSKMDERVLPLFPQIFAMIGDGSSLKVLRKLLSYPAEEVRIESIHAVGKFKRDDLLPKVRILASQHHPKQQEACAKTLGLLKDEEAIPKLESMCRSGCVNVRLAALQALYRLGQKQRRLEVEEIAQNGNLFAIAMLGEMPGSEDFLAKLVESSSLNIRLNAALALLDRQDTRCLKGIAEILIKDSRDLAFVKNSSNGRALTSWRATPSAEERSKEAAILGEMSLHLRELVLIKTLDLNEKAFLAIAETLLKTRQNELIPTLAILLENHRTANSIALLIKYQQLTGAPLIRNYCNLSLYRLKEKGPYVENLIQWMLTQKETELISFRPYVPLNIRDNEWVFQLTPFETSRLLVESFEALVKRQDERAIPVLLEAIKSGNSHNKYALAGLLIRSTL
jgi:HEAT repeat protein